MSSELKHRYARTRPTLDCNGDSRTKQAEAEQCDINYIVNLYHKTGSFSHVTGNMPTYDDFSNATDYQTALNQVKEAESLFMDLPSKLRSEFHNDPGELLSFINDPENEQAAIDMDLLEGVKSPPKPPEPVPEPAQPETD